jgi:hypothetical protein
VRDLPDLPKSGRMFGLIVYTPCRLLIYINTSIDLGARTSLIIYIYLQPWSISMALAPSISWISRRSPKT